MGSRLGLGMPKALLEIGGRPLIFHHLEQLRDCDDVRVVVGYQHERVIETVLRFRRDVLFVFNHAFRTTQTLASLCLGAGHGRDLVLSLDGDLLVRPQDMRRFLTLDEEALGITTPYSDEPVYCAVDTSTGAPQVTAFSREVGPFEWTGLALIRRDHLVSSDGFVFECLSKHLPCLGVPVDCREIDTAHDLENARAWLKHLTEPRE